MHSSAPILPRLDPTDSLSDFSHLRRHPPKKARQHPTTFAKTNPEKLRGPNRSAAMKGFTREISPARSPSASQKLRASVAWKAHEFILAAEEWEGVDWWVISQVIRWFQSSRVADYSSSPFEQTRQRQHASPLEERQGRPKAETLEGPPYSPLRIPVLELTCSSDVSVLNRNPFSTLAINFNYNAWSIRGNFHRCSESHRVALGTGCSFSLCRRPERAETDYAPIQSRYSDHSGPPVTTRTDQAVTFARRTSPPSHPAQNRSRRGRIGPR